MTTKVYGIQWAPDGLHLVQVDDVLEYLRGSAGGFDIYDFHPIGSEGKVTVTDGPTGTLLHWNGDTKVTVDGQVEGQPRANYELREGSTLVAQGPKISEQQAELTITFTPSGSPERPF